jgi:hypothetical protein
LGNGVRTAESAQLTQFLSTVSPSFGWGREAIEVGLQHVNTELAKGVAVTQVILIGDAAANTDDEVTQKRRGGRVKWDQSTRFGTATTYKSELSKLVQRRIPVHAFYVHKNAEQCFREIVEEAGKSNEQQCRCEFLPANDPKGAAVLTMLVRPSCTRRSTGSWWTACARWLSETRWRWSGTGC